MAVCAERSAIAATAARIALNESSRFMTAPDGLPELLSRDQNGAPLDGGRDNLRIHEIIRKFRAYRCPLIAQKQKSP
jgi:hypothetical protein